tara:strand:- start:97449 stop:97919 length:471 start_codon:yes stop_codon:yes gene_type:complete
MANKKISQLPLITTPDNASLFPVVKSGITSSITFLNLKNVIGGGNKLIEIQEFLASEPIIDRGGDSFLSIPSALNGYTLSAFAWSVFSVDTGTFTISLERNGVSIGTTAVTASTQNATVSITPVTLATNDIIRIVTSSSSGSTPLGLVVNLEAIKP